MYCIILNSAFDSPNKKYLLHKYVIPPYWKRGNNKLETKNVEIKRMGKNNRKERSMRIAYIMWTILLTILTCTCTVQSTETCMLRVFSCGGALIGAQTIVFHLLFLYNLAREAFRTIYTCNVGVRNKKKIIEIFRIPTMIFN